MVIGRGYGHQEPAGYNTADSSTIHDSVSHDSEQNFFTAALPFWSFGCENRVVVKIIYIDETDIIHSGIEQ